MSSIQIVLNDQVAIAAGCLDAKLNRGRMSPLHSALDDIWDGGNIGRHRVVGAMIDGKYVGCATFTKRTKFIQVFVDEAYRRQGIGTALISALEESVGISRDQFHARGDETSQAFFDRNKIYELPGTFPISQSELSIIQHDPRAAGRIIRQRQREYRKAWLERVSQSKNPTK
ncbi:hypothetical protein D9M68_18860 [compost metagenome]